MDGSIRRGRGRRLCEEDACGGKFSTSYASASSFALGHSRSTRPFKTRMTHRRPSSVRTSCSIASYIDVRLPSDTPTLEATSDLEQELDSLSPPSPPLTPVRPPRNVRPVGVHAGAEGPRRQLISTPALDDTVLHLRPVRVEPRRSAIGL